ncbi:MAG: cellulose biosynthesis protein BcsF [Plesiomonas sp.]
MDLVSFGQVTLITAVLAGLLGFYLRPLWQVVHRMLRHVLRRPRYNKRLMTLRPSATSRTSADQ